MNGSGIIPDGWKMDLPTEAQWEYACRAGEAGPHLSGSINEVACHQANPHTTPSHFRACHAIPTLLGGTDPRGHSSGPGVVLRVYRGGSWRHYSISNVRDAGSGWSQDGHYNFLGFRPALVHQRQSSATSSAPYYNPAEPPVRSRAIDDQEQADLKRPSSATSTIPDYKSTNALPLTGEHFPETRLRLIDVEFARGLKDAQIRYAINEMFARHGAIFPQEEINKVFQNKPWYQPDRNISFDEIERIRFSQTERDNLKILAAERELRKNNAQAVQSQPAQISRMRFIDSFGNLRSGPGTQFAIIRNPRQGESGAIKERNGNWILLRFDSGESGWAHARNLETDK